MKLLCNRLKFHEWEHWRPGAKIRVVEDSDKYSKTVMWRQCLKCGWIATKEVYGTYQEKK